MVRPSDLVIVRTSRSAEDFWSRVRDEAHDVSPDFKAHDQPRDTPFGKQKRPTFIPYIPPPLESSRVVERRIMQGEIDLLEQNVLTNKDPSYIRKLVSDNERLRRDVARLEKENASAQHNLKMAWKLMNGLTGEVKRVVSKAS